MFVQVIQGQVADAEQAHAAFDRWVEELAPEDLPERHWAEVARLDWLMERTVKRLEALGVELKPIR